MSVAEIAREVGVSHTTLFNRFGSKEGLLIAALGPSETVPWVASLDAGPDARSIRDQLVEHGKVISSYFQTLQERLAVLRAAGITPEQLFRTWEGDPPPVQAFEALSAWLRRARARHRIAACDVETLVSTILGVFHNQAFVARVCQRPSPPEPGGEQVERFVDLLWKGIEPTP